MLDEAVILAGDLMNRDVAVVHPDTPLLDAVKLMAQCHISGVPVVDDTGAIVGMLSEGDLVRWHEGYTEKQAQWLDMLAEGHGLAPSFLEGIRARRSMVKSVMSPHVIAVTEQTSARDIAHLMHTKNIKRVPVLRDGKLIGIVARSDLIRAFAQRLGETPSVPMPQTVNEALRRRREEAGAWPHGPSRRHGPTSDRNQTE